MWFNPLYPSPMWKLRLRKNKLYAHIHSWSEQCMRSITTNIQLGARVRLCCSIFFGMFMRFDLRAQSFTFDSIGLCICICLCVSTYFQWIFVMRICCFCSSCWLRLPHSYCSLSWCVDWYKQSRIARTKLHFLLLWLRKLPSFDERNEMCACVCCHALSWVQPNHINKIIHNFRPLSLGSTNKYDTHVQSTTIVRNTLSTRSS